MKGRWMAGFRQQQRTAVLQANAKTRGDSVWCGQGAPLQYQSGEEGGDWESLAAARGAAEERKGGKDENNGGTSKRSGIRERMFRILKSSPRDQGGTGRGSRESATVVNNLS